MLGEPESGLAHDMDQAALDQGLRPNLSQGFEQARVGIADDEARSDALIPERRQQAHPAGMGLSLGKRPGHGDTADILCHQHDLPTRLDARGIQHQTPNQGECGSGFHRRIPEARKAISQGPGGDAAVRRDPLLAEALQQPRDESRLMGSPLPIRSLPRGGDRTRRTAKPDRACRRQTPSLHPLTTPDTAFFITVSPSINQQKH